MNVRSEIAQTSVQGGVVVPYDNGEQLSKYTKAEQSVIEQSRVIAMNINRHKYKQSDVYRVISQCSEYIEECQRERKPITLAGFMLATNIPASTWSEMKNGDKDNITSLYALQHSNQVDENGEPFYLDEQTGEARPLVTFSAVVKNCYLVVQNQLEGNCYTNRGNPAGSIFGLKAQFGWSDDTTPQNLTQVVQICDAEQARKALELLR